MIKKLAEYTWIIFPESYGLIEGKGLENTDIDEDEDGDYFQDCEDCFPGDFGLIEWAKNNS